MGVFVVAAVVALLVVWRGWRKRVLTRGEWRAGAGVLGIGAVIGAGLVAIRGDWELGVALAVLGAVLLAGARSQRGPYAKRTPAGRAAAALSAEEARALLGVGASAGPEEIRAAHARLIRMAHPDRGGTTGLAAQINAARDRLLKGG